MVSNVERKRLLSPIDRGVPHSRLSLFKTDSETRSRAWRTDVAHLKDITPAQSHTMIDVGYHMSNLWFAAQHKNWDLAAFEVDETRNRIRWTIRISPTRKTPDGEIVDIKGIFDGVAVRDFRHWLAKFRRSPGPTALRSSRCEDFVRVDCRSGWPSSCR